MRSSLWACAAAGMLSGAVSAPCMLLRACEGTNMGCFAAKEHGWFRWSTHILVLIKSRCFQWYWHQAGFSKRPAQQDGEEGATSPYPSSHLPMTEPKGWSKLGLGKALPHAHGPAKPCKEPSAAHGWVKPGSKGII